MPIEPSKRLMNGQSRLDLIAKWLMFCRTFGCGTIEFSKEVDACAICQLESFFSLI